MIDGLEADVVTLALSRTTSTRIAAQARLIAGGLGRSGCPNNSGAVHLDDRVPGAQGQPEGHPRLGRPRQAGRRASSRRTRRPPAARAGPTSPPGATRDQGRRHDGAGARSSSRSSTSNVPVLDAGGARRDDDLRRSAASATCCSPGRTRRYSRSRRVRRTSFEIVVSVASASWPSRRSRRRQGRRQARARAKLAEALPRVPLRPTKAQEIAAKHHYRPRYAGAAREVRRATSRSCRLFTIDEVFGGWTKAQKDALRRRRRSSTRSYAPGSSATRAIERGMLLSRALLKRHSVLPGFDLALGFTLLYLALIVLIPLVGGVPEDVRRSSWPAFWAAVTAPRVVASYRLTFGASFAGGARQRRVRAHRRLGAGALSTFPARRSSTRSSTCRSRCRPRSPASR